MVRIETFELSKDDVAIGLQLAATKATAGGYNDIVEESMALYRRRSNDGERPANRGVFDAPPVQYLIDVTLGTLAVPSVAARLPLEVWRRSRIASGLGIEIASAPQNIGIYALQYREYGELPKAEEGAMRNTRRLQSLVNNVFRESCFIAGGVLQLLQQKGIAEEPGPILKRSITLPKKVGGVFSPRVNELYAKLGDPYILPEHLRLHTDRKGVTVGYSKNATLALDSMRRMDPGNAKSLTEGCPVMHMPSPRHDKQTILIDEWWRFVDFLVPPEATAIPPDGDLPVYSFTNKV